MRKEKVAFLEDESLIREGLFVFPRDESDTPRLIGSQCKKCGDVVFPKRMLCAMCDADELMEEVFIGEQGILHTYTVVRIGYEGFDVPYVLGVIELSDSRDVHVLSQIEDCDPEELHPGMPLALTIGKIKKDVTTGKDIIGYKYRPIRQ